MRAAAALLCLIAIGLPAAASAHGANTNLTLSPPPPSECDVCDDPTDNPDFETPQRAVVLERFSENGTIDTYVVDVDQGTICHFLRQTGPGSNPDLSKSCGFKKMSRQDLHDIVAEANFVWRQPPKMPGVTPIYMTTVYIRDHKRTYWDLVYPAGTFVTFRDPKEGLADAIMAAAR